MTLIISFIKKLKNNIYKYTVKIVKNICEKKSNNYYILTDGAFFYVTKISKMDNKK